MNAGTLQPVTRLMCLSMNVYDLARSARFYREALGFEPEGEPTPAGPAWARLLGGDFTTLRMRLGAQRIELARFDQSGAPYPADGTAADLYFQHFALLTSDMDAAYARLQKHGATPITRGGPQRLPAASGGVTAYKFRDPDGHPLELLAFPRAGSDALPATPITTGIDHTAISVADAERSIAFYGRLGLAVTARQLNRGLAQEALDALAGVEVEVVALRPATPTPHVELLAYRRPRGRPQAPAMHLQDIAATRMLLQVAHLPADPLPPADTEDLESAASPDSGRMALLRDPDGHLIVLAEQI